MDQQNQQLKEQKEQNPKQQVVERVKNATNVLVTVSENPSVDQLSACIGLTLMLNKLDKHATAVFSGSVPSTLEFLQPEKTLEATTDSLRDFIISLDKSKADKLRYKVEDDVVKIFITPYRTSITADDLDFSQGDFNVDVVIALGVTSRDHLDRAIIEHGSILHDAVVIGISCNSASPSDVGTINWHESTASSLCEMLVSISESFQSGLIDAQMATAFLTGIVAETERFSNEKTTPKAMTMSAQLMAAGANQQLIANQLAIQPEPPEVPESPAQDSRPEDDEPDAGGVLDVNGDNGQPPAGGAPVTPIEQGSGVDGLSFDVRDSDNTESKPMDVEDVAKSLGASGHDVTDVGSGEEGGGSEEPRPARIDIDDKGKLTDLEEREKNQHHQKVIEPLGQKPPQPKTDLASYVFEPPENGGTLTANTVPEHEQPDVTVDPLSNPPTEDTSMPPLLEHNAPATGSEKPDVAPAPEVTNVVEEPAPSTEQNGQTLADLEQAIGRAPVPPASPDAARDAVNKAMADASYVPPAPEPKQAAGAAIVELDTVPPTTPEAPLAQPSQDQPVAPPQYPPPLVPPYMQPAQPPPPQPEGELNLPPPQQQP